MQGVAGKTAGVSLRGSLPCPLVVSRSTNNHLHLLLRLDPEVARAWFPDDGEVVRRVP